MGTLVVAAPVESCASVERASPVKDVPSSPVVAPGGPSGSALALAAMSSSIEIVRAMVRRIVDLPDARGVQEARQRVGRGESMRPYLARGYVGRGEPLSGSGAPRGARTS